LLNDELTFKTWQLQNCLLKKRGLKLGDDFYNFIIKRCEEALLENEEYITKEHKSEQTSDDLQEMAEVLCYKKGFMDAMHILKCSHIM
jgi:hypothetical protein